MKIKATQTVHTIILFFLFITTASGQFCQINLLQNGDFENGLSNWNGNATLTQYTTWNSQHVQICQNGERIYQTVAAQPNTDYSLQVQAREDLGNQGLVSIKFLNSSWIPIGQEWLELNDSGFSPHEIRVTSPANTTWVEISLLKNSGNQFCIMADEFFLCEGNIGLGLPDLVPLVTPGVTTAQNTEALTYSLSIKNQGIGAGPATGYIAKLSDDMVFDLTDETIGQGSPQPYFLNPNESTNTVNGEYFIPPSNTFNGTKYIIIQVDYLDNQPEVDEFNNTFVFPVQISTGGGPNNCKADLGDVELLCTSKSGNNLDVYLLDNQNLSKLVLDQQGNMISNTPQGIFATDSVLVQGNQVIKKLQNGSIAFTKNIPQVIQDSFTRIDAAVQLGNGEIVIAGYERSVNTGIPPSYNILKFVRTDANLDPLQWEQIRRNQQTNPGYDYSREQVWAMYPRPNNEFDILVSSSNITLTINTYLALNRFASDLSLLDFTSVTQNPGLSWSFVETPCGSYFYNGGAGFYAQKSQFTGSQRSYYSQSDFSEISYQTTGSGSIDYYGSYVSSRFRSWLPDSLIGGYQYRPMTDPIPNLEYILTDAGQADRLLEIPIFNYEHAARVGTSDIILFGKNNGQLFMEVPTDCSTLIPFQPDFTGENLEITGTITGVNGNEHVNFAFDLKNIGNKSIPTGTIKNKLYFSTDQNFDASDVFADEYINSTPSAGQTERTTDQTEVPLSLPNGTYYLISVLDEENQHLESNENNNIIISTDTYQVGSGGGTCQGNLIPSDKLLSPICSPSTTTNNGDLVNIPSSGNQSYQFKVNANTDDGSFAFIRLKYMSNTWQVIGEKSFFPTATTQLYSHDFITPANTAFIEISQWKFGAGCLITSDWCLISGDGNSCNPDIMPPTISNCPSDVNDVVSPGTGQAPAYWTAPTATDNCGAVTSFTSTHNSGDLFPTGQSVEVVYTAVDAANNSSICSFFVTIAEEGPIGADLTAENLNLTTYQGQGGQIVNFNFDLKNIGFLAADGNFTVKTYFSLNQTLSIDDVHDGTIPTGFLAAGQSILQTPGAFTVPNSLADGTYWILLKVDADETIPEMDETNNTLISTGQFTVQNAPNNCPGNMMNPNDIEPFLCANPNETWSDLVNIPAQGTAAYSISAWMYTTNGISGFLRLKYLSSSWQVLDQSNRIFNNQSSQLRSLTLGAPAQTAWIEVAYGTLVDAGCVYATDWCLSPISAPMPFIQGTATAIEIGDARVYPNPAMDFLHVDLSDFENQELTVRLVNMSGTTVFSQSGLFDAITQFDLSSLESGQYYLQIISEQQRPVVKRVQIVRN